LERLLVSGTYMSRWSRKGLNKCTIEEILRQVGYLPELYDKGLSEKY
jgi:hypothetical protein